MNPKLLIITGPTATGKTNLGIYLAKKYKGEIISADSRQVYKGLDIISGKDIHKNSTLKSPFDVTQGKSFDSAQGKQNSKLGIQNQNLSVGFRVKDTIPIWLVDIAAPSYPFNVSEYRNLADIVIGNILQRKKLPIVVGGTGLYIKSLIEPLTTIDIPPNRKLRQTLALKSVAELGKILININRPKFSQLNQSDRNNPRRLIRAIEITLTRKNFQTKYFNNLHQVKNILKIGLISKLPLLFKKIDLRVEKRFHKGALIECKRLMATGFSDKLPVFSTIGISELRDYLLGIKSKSQAVTSWKLAEKKYAKKQITWLKKDKSIRWFDINDSKFITKVDTLVQTWYSYRKL